MQHLLISVYIFTFITGFISVYHLSTRYDLLKYSFLKTYKYHILVFNLYVLSLAVTRYYKINIVNTIQSFGSMKMQHAADALFLFQKGVEYFGIIIIAYTLIKILYQIQERTMANLIKHGFIFMLTISAFAYGIGVTNFLNRQEAHWLNLFCDILSGILFLPVIGIFTFSSIRMRRTKNDNREFSLHFFMFFYLIFLSLFLLENLLIFKYKNLFVPAIILMINLFPMFWNKCNRQKESPNGVSLNINMANLERIVSEYHISDREREIFEYILQGYSNREIQHRLFLSHHTIKNHNYNLYKKLGVRNRSELMRKAFEYQCNK